MENIERIKRKINLDKFAFVYEQPTLHNKAFLGRTTLKAGVLICGIIDLICATGFVLHAVEHYSFLFFVAYFIPSVVIIAGSAITLLSLENLDVSKANMGYITSAVSLWLFALSNVLSNTFTFLWSPSYFITNLFTTLLILILSVGTYTYGVWIYFCYVKHLSAGNKDLVEFGRGDGLIEKDGAVTQLDKAPKEDIQISDIERH